MVIHSEILEPRSVEPVIKVYAHRNKLRECLIVAVASNLFIHEEREAFDADTGHCTGIQCISDVAVVWYQKDYPKAWGIV